MCALGVCEGSGGREVLAMVGEDGYVEDDEALEDEHVLSPEEYEEMMRYIEEACREEDLRAEAEVQLFLVVSRISTASLFR